VQTRSQHRDVPHRKFQTAGRRSAVLEYIEQCGTKRNSDQCVAVGQRQHGVGEPDGRALPEPRTDTGRDRRCRPDPGAAPPGCSTSQEFHSLRAISGVARKVAEELGGRAGGRIAEEAARLERTAEEAAWRQATLAAVPEAEALEKHEAECRKRQRMGVSDDIRETAARLHFSPQEVEQFHEVFTSWTSVSAKDLSAHKWINPDGRTLGNIMVEIQEGALSYATFRRLIRTLGVSMSRHQRETLQKRFASSHTNGTGNLSFIGFLEMMRWLLDSDFAGINNTVAKAVDRSPSKGRCGNTHLC